MSQAGLDARRAAVDALVAVLDRRTPLDLALANASGMARLEPRDRGFARTIVSTTLRRLGRIDAALDAFLSRPTKKTAAYPLAILRAGAAQLLFLDTPAYAVVDSMTALADADRRSRKLKGVVNAVLRRVSERGPSVIAGKVALDDWPKWLTESWRKAYGAPHAARIAVACGAEPPLDLTVKADAAGWAERLGGAVTPTGSVRLTDAGDVRALAGFDEGAWWVQDAAAALPARLLGDVAGRRVVDLCAAPGGKTLQLAAAGARVTAVDRDADRLARVRENLERTRLTADIAAADVVEFAPGELFDAALLDAPCTATGTLRRHPDVAWSKRPSDGAELAALQIEMLDAASRLLKPGGVLVFCTCSLQPEEGPAIAAAAAAVEALRPSPITAADVPGLPEAVTADGHLRTTPDLWTETGGLDGFFAARFTRV